MAGSLVVHWGSCLGEVGTGYEVGVPLKTDTRSEVGWVREGIA